MIVITLVATLGAIIVIANIWLDVPNTESEKLFAGFIVLGCCVLAMFGLLSIAVVKTEESFRRCLNKFKQSQ